MPAIMAVISAAGAVCSNKALDLSRPTLAMVMGVLMFTEGALDLSVQADHGADKSQLMSRRYRPSHLSESARASAAGDTGYWAATAPADHRPKT
jgi:hypothetical protein